MVSSHNVFGWINNVDTSGVLYGAVTRDCSPRRNYVIRASYSGTFIAGNYEEGKDYAEIEYFGYKSSVDWEFLVSNEHVAGMGIILIMFTSFYNCRLRHIDGLVQERRNPRALAMLLRLSCTNPAI